MSLFSTVELAPRDPILGLTEQFNADPNPSKVNLGVGVYFDENGKLPLLKCVAEAEALIAGHAQAARLPADRRHRRLRQGGAGPRLRRRQRGRDGQSHRHRASPGRHRRTEGRRRLPATGEAGGKGPDQRPELGKPSRAVHERGLRGRHLSVLRRRRRTASTLPACLAHCRTPPRAPSSCCMRAATTRPATTSRRRSGNRWFRQSRCAN